ncbi:MAG TPA: hypothetical protein VF493_16425 [Terriglobales bacterium]
MAEKLSHKNLQGLKPGAPYGIRRTAEAVLFYGGASTNNGARYRRAISCQESIYETGSEYSGNSK